MENEQNPYEIKTEILTEVECARRLSVTRESLYRWRQLPERAMPYVPLSDGPKPDIRYVWADVFDWFRSRSRNLEPVSASRHRGRPRNVDRGGAR